MFLIFTSDGTVAAVATTLLGVMTAAAEAVGQ